MALLQWTPNSLFSSPTGIRKPRQLLLRASSSNNNSDVAVVWFKHDIRIDDHPALVSSSTYSSVLPLYIFDHRIISRFSDTSLEVALLALQDLKTSLQDQGSDLVIRFGGAESIVSNIVNQLGVADVFTEDEVEYDLRNMITSVQQTCPNVVLWRTPFYDIKSLSDFPAFYSEFEKLKLPVTSPLAPPVLPRLEIDIERGSIPTFDEVKKYMDAWPEKPNESWTSIKKISAKSVLSKARLRQGKILNPGDGDQYDMNFRRKPRKNSAFPLRNDNNVVGGGTRVVLNALSGYLRYLEGTARDDYQEVHEKLRGAESRSGASFGALFLPALSLGILSSRKVHFDAIKYEKERNGGFLSPFGYSGATVAAPIDTVCSMEWYRLMALRSQTYNGGRHAIRLWKWNGYLVQYTVVGHEGPAILLVHGFGAFLEHYRHNIDSIAGSGNRVWAISLIGFGKSEKPNVVYTELLWAELLRDFIVDVVGEPAHLVGNSVGGYFVAIVAGLWPALVKSIVLINTAGSAITGSSSIPFGEERKTSGAVWLGSRLLLLFLRLRVGNILKDCYPTNPSQADDWLISEMLRASHDPGCLILLESVFNFNLAIPLDYLFESFGGKVLVIQGMKDPLSKSEMRLSMLREHCSSVMIKELDAGHCPHDERPEEVNSLICKWLVSMEKNLQLC